MSLSSGVSPSLAASPIRDFITSESFRDLFDRYRACGWLPNLTAEDFLRIRQKLDLTQEAFGEVLGHSVSSVKRWESGRKPAPAELILYAALDHLEGELFHLIQAPAGERLHLIGVTLSNPSLPPKVDDAVALCEARARASDLPRHFTSNTIQQLRDRWKLSPANLAQILDLSVSTIHKWESGSSSPPTTTQMLLRLLWRDGPVSLQLLRG